MSNVIPVGLSRTHAADAHTQALCDEVRQNIHSDGCVFFFFTSFKLLVICNFV